MFQNEDNRNLIYFVLSSVALLFLYQFFVVEPSQKREAAARAAQASASKSASAQGPLAASNLSLSLPKAIASTPRVSIETNNLKGSISLIGARIDDLSLQNYNQTLEDKTKKVRLFEPVGTDNAFFAETGFLAENVQGLPSSNSLWQLVSGSVLAVGKPVTLEYASENGLKFLRTFEVDENYLITIKDEIVNGTAAPISLKPYAQIVRRNLPRTKGNEAVHEGPIATWSRQKNSEPEDFLITEAIKYNDIVKKGAKTQDSVGGWFGLSDTYWLAAVVPDQKSRVTALLRASKDDKKIPSFQAGYMGQMATIPANAKMSQTTKIFAGAKQNKLMTEYETSQNIPRLSAAIDWGMLSMLTHPMHWLLEQLYKVLKNFGLAILALTVVVKAIFFPLAHSSYKSMLQMKAVQQHLAPKLEEIKKRYPDDAKKQQEETMALYQREKINPMAGLTGCLPMLLQIPVFFALYKVLLISIDMRHAPFFGFIQDLSAPDPTNLFNLFGLLPFDPATVPLIGGLLAGPLDVGVVAILYGLSMWLSQNLTPMAGVDEMQKKIFAFMPIIFTFVMAPFAIGLLVYWVWSNILTMIQQYTIMRQLKVDNIVDDTLKALKDRFAKKPDAA